MSLPLAAAALATAVSRGRLEAAPWLFAAVLIPLFSGLFLIAGRRALDLRPGLRRVVRDGASVLPGLVFVVASMRLALGPSSLVGFGHAVVSFEALRITTEVGATPVVAGAGIALCAGVFAAVFARRGTADAREEGLAHVAFGLTLLALLANDAVVACAAVAGAGFPLWLLTAGAAPTGRSLRPVVLLGIGSFSALFASFLLFWSLGATRWNEHGQLLKDVSLARLVAVPAAHEIVSRPPTPVPVGIDEAVAAGDRLALDAGWVVAGPTFSRRLVADLLHFPSTGVQARLEAMQRRKLPVPFLVALFVAAGALLASAAGPFGGWVGATSSASHATGITSTLAIGLGVSLVLRFTPLLPIAGGAGQVVALAGAVMALLAALGAGRRDPPTSPHILAVLACGGLLFVSLVLGEGPNAALVAMAILALQLLVAPANDVQEKRIRAAGGFVTAFVLATLVVALLDLATPEDATKPRSFLLDPLLAAFTLAISFALVRHRPPPHADPARRRAMRLATVAGGLLLVAIGALAVVGPAATGRLRELAAIVVALVAGVLSGLRESRKEATGAHGRDPHRPAEVLHDALSTVVRMFANFLATLDRVLAEVPWNVLAAALLRLRRDREAKPK